VDDDRRTWDDRHAEQLAGPPLPPAGLDEVLDALPPAGPALDVACGLGATAVWAAQQGFEVLGLDVSPVAVAAATELARTVGVADRARFVVHDLDRGLPAEAVGPHQLVVCQRFRQPDLYRVLSSSLAPGGLLVVTVLSTVGHRGRRSPYRAEPGELLDAFDDLEVLFAREGAGEATVVARRPGAG
jgi:2-polyprenyl-3-methyl-5-hydroxy-6-metoxy-1,4-benzoquinol methylase